MFAAVAPVVVAPLGDPIVASEEAEEVGGGLRIIMFHPNPVVLEDDEVAGCPNPNPKPLPVFELDAGAEVDGNADDEDDAFIASL